MGDGIQWLADGDALTGWVTGVVFARGIDAEELAVRMGGAPGAGTEPITDAEVMELDMGNLPAPRERRRCCPRR